MLEKLVEHGIVFQRNPYTGRAWIENWETSPADLRASVLARWGDVEAILNEQALPRHNVSLRCAGELLGIDPKKELPPPPPKRIKQTL